MRDIISSTWTTTTWVTGASASVTVSNSRRSRNALLLFALLYSISILTPVHSSVRNKDDINAEIKKFQNRIEKFEKPSPELIKSLIEQAQEQCKTNRTFDENVAKNMSTCIDGLFNSTQLQIEFEEAIPKGELDDAFRKVCLKWPEVKNCMHDAFVIMEECFDKGVLVTKGMDSMVEFFCGAKNDGALIALFLAEGGLNCLEQHGDTVRDCINEHNTEENQEDLCKSVETVSKCAVTFKKCSDPTPENLISSMLRQVQKVMGCPVTSEAYKSGSSGAAAVIGVIQTSLYGHHGFSFSLLASIVLVAGGAFLTL